MGNKRIAKKTKARGLYRNRPRRTEGEVKEKAGAATRKSREAHCKRTHMKITKNKISKKRTDSGA